MDLAKKLASGAKLVLDGGMGSLLVAMGCDFSSDDYNLDFAKGVEDAHKQYVEAGSDCLITNTFSLNRIYASKKGIADLERSNKAAVEIARRAAGDEVFVLGDLGPTGDLLEPYGQAKEADVREAYREQACYLSEAGVDGFIIETTFQLREALLALEAVRSVSALPVLVSLTFSSLKKGGVTLMGDQAIQCAEAVKAGGGSAVGANCGDLTPQELAQVVQSMLPAGLPVCIQPNAGKPRLEGSDTYYDMSPQAYAMGMKACLEAGAAIIGGCCGTTPAHIKALRELVSQFSHDNV